MARHSLWVEGYAATGEHGAARFLGTYEADTFSEAVQKWNAEKNSKNTYGCRIFDNERSARRSFG